MYILYTIKSGSKSNSQDYLVNDEIQFTGTKVSKRWVKRAMFRDIGAIHTSEIDLSPKRFECERSNAN